MKNNVKKVKWNTPRTGIPISKIGQAFGFNKVAM